MLFPGLNRAYLALVRVLKLVTALLWEDDAAAIVSGSLSRFRPGRASATQSPACDAGAELGSHAPTRTRHYRRVEEIGSHSMAELGFCEPLEDGKPNIRPETSPFSNWDGGIAGGAPVSQSRQHGAVW